MTGIAMAERMPAVRTEVRRVARLLREEAKPKGPILTPFNVVSGIIMLVAAVLLTIRFATGLGSITNLSQDYPWGLWIGFDVITGVAFAGGAYVVTFMVYVLGMKLSGEAFQQHLAALIIGVMLILIGFQCVVIGLIGELLSAPQIPPFLLEGGDDPESAAKVPA